MIYKFLLGMALLCSTAMGVQEAQAIDLSDFQAVQTMADKGQAEAQFAMCSAYYQGIGVEQNFKKAS